MKLSIIIPVFNEKNTVINVIDKILSIKLPVEKEIIVVDDCSTDGTSDILRASVSKYKNVLFLFHKKNTGKGGAVHTGIDNSCGDIIVIQDADLEYNPEDFNKLLKPILDNQSSVVYGSRILGSKNRSYNRYYWGGRLLSFITNFLYGSNITDEATCYKMIKKEVIEKIKLKCKDFAFCPEITSKILRLKYEIIDVPISYNPRKIEEGKKIRWHDGLKAIWVLLKYRFVPEKYITKY